MSARAWGTNARDAVAEGADYPIGREEARADAAHTRKAIARLRRKQQRLAAQMAQVAASLTGAEIMLRTIFGVYPDLDDELVQVAGGFLVDGDCQPVT